MKLRSPLVSLAASVVVVFIYFALTVERFGTPENVRTILATASVLGVVAVAVTFGLAAGAIDFSIAGHMALTGVLVAWLGERVPWAVAILLVLGVAVAVGLVNALVTVRFGVNPFIATLAMAGTLRGFAFVMAGSSAGVLISDGPLVELGQGRTAGVPNQVVVFVLVTIVGMVVMRSSTWGRGLLAVGGNQEAARLAGIGVRTTLTGGYVTVAVGAALAGLLLAGRTGAGIPQAANGQELLVFSAVILGGTALWGGRASVGGTVLGICLLTTLSNGLTLAQTSPYWQTILQGAALIAAVWAISRRQDRPQQSARTSATTAS